MGGPRKGGFYTKEQLAEKSRENGKKGGRPPGARNSLPVNAVKAIKTMKFRVKEQYKDDENISEIAGYSFERICDVMAGKVNSKKSPSVLKASVTVREEICEPVVKEAKISGEVSIVSAVKAASDAILGKKE